MSHCKLSVGLRINLNISVLKLNLELKNNLAIVPFPNKKNDPIFDQTFFALAGIDNLFI